MSMELLSLLVRTPLLLTMAFVVVTGAAAARFNSVEYAEFGRAPELRLTFMLNAVVGLIAVPVGLIMSVVFWAWVRPPLARARKQERAVSDDVWWSAGRYRFTQAVGQFATSPEGAVAGGDGCRRAGDRAAALWFYQEAVERLHLAYVEQHMATRTPTIEDSRVLMPYLQILHTMRALRRPAVVNTSARHAGHRLAQIIQACQAAGHDAALYNGALERLSAVTAPR
jgi:hypothetical protein